MCDFGVVDVVFVLVGWLVVVYDELVWCDWIVVEVGDFDGFGWVGEVEDWDVVLILGLYYDVVIWDWN